MSSHPTTVQHLRQPAPRHEVAMGFGNLESFELMQRAAKLLASSTLVPAAYRAEIHKTDRYGTVTDTRQNPNALANAVVALNMAQRVGADPLMVMQNLYIVEGRPSWSSQWIIAAINSCGRFSPLRFDIKRLGKKKVEYVTFVWENKQRREERKTVEIEDQRCIAWAVESGVTIPQFGPDDLKEFGGVYGCCKEYGTPLIESPEVSIELAVKEGWFTKSGSKWQTMPDVMLRYRTASFFGKLHAPELLMGLQTAEEVHDTIDVTPADDGTLQVDAEALREAPATRAPRQARRPAPEPEPATDVEMNTSSEKAKAEAGKPVPEAESSAPAAQANAPANKLIVYPSDYVQVMNLIRAAEDIARLDDLAAEIQDCDPAHQKELTAAYRRRLDELDGVVHTPEPAAPARTRRAAPDME